MGRILVIDDEPLVAALLEDLLGDLHCEMVGPAASLAEAQSLLDATPVDAAILAVTVGRASAQPAATALQARRIPFAFSSADSELDWMAHFPDAPLLLKPFTITDLASVLKRLSEAARAGA